MTGGAATALEDLMTGGATTPLEDLMRGGAATALEDSMTGGAATAPVVLVAEVDSLVLVSVVLSTNKPGKETAGCGLPLALISNDQARHSSMTAYQAISLLISLLNNIYAIAFC